MKTVSLIKTISLIGFAFALLALLGAQGPNLPVGKLATPPVTPPAKKVTDEHKLVFKDLQIRLLQGRIAIATAQQQDEANAKALNDYVTMVLQSDCGGSVDQNLNCVAPPTPPISKPDQSKK